MSDLMERVAARINIHLRELGFDVRPYLLPEGLGERFGRQVAYYGLCEAHPVHALFQRAAVGGSYFLGCVEVEHSVIYGSDLRGDELKRRGQFFSADGVQVGLHHDEVIQVHDSALLQTLVHNFSHDPELPETYPISAAAAMPWSNIHGAPILGGFLGAFATADLTTVRDSVLGPYSYVQVGELSHARIEPGALWISGDGFEVRFTHDPDVLARYVSQAPGGPVQGILADLMRERDADFARIYGQTPTPRDLALGAGSSVSPYAVVKGEVSVAENVLVAQSAHVEDATLGPGADVQESCIVAHSQLAGQNVNAHGASVLHARCGEGTFAGFNALLRGAPQAPLDLGAGCVVMPHTLIDLEAPVTVPPDTLLWGHIARPADLADRSVPLQELSEVTGSFERGGLRLTGSGARFVEGFRHRIHHILQENGAFFDGTAGQGHAQTEQRVTFHLLQPYVAGPRAGLLPSLTLSE